MRPLVHFHAVSGVTLTGAKNGYLTTMSYDINVSRDSSDAPTATSDFFAEVKNGRDETTEVSGGYGSYPRIYIVTLGGDSFYGFITDLDEGRGPWAAGYEAGEISGAGTWFDRGTVLDAETLEAVDPNGKAYGVVRYLIAMADDEADASAETELF